MGQKPSFPAFNWLKNARQRQRNVRWPQVRIQGSRMTIWDHAHSIRNNIIALEHTLQKILVNIYFVSAN